MTVCQRENIQMSTETKSDPTLSDTCDLDELFYESVNLSDKLSRYVSECQVFLQDEEFRRVREQCEEVLDQPIPGTKTKEPETKEPETKEPETKEPETKEPETAKNLEQTPHTKNKTPMSLETTEASDDEHEDEMKLSSSSASSLTESEIELSDELTEVSSTDSISNHSDGETVELEIDDFNFKDCSVTRRVNPRPPVSNQKSPKSKRGLSTNARTRRYINQVDKKVSCKCCRSVMGRIVHEVRQSENAVNIANIKPYQPKTSIITNVKEAVDFQIQYEREWYAAIMIQRAWRAYHGEKMRQIRMFENIRQKNEMRLKYGHIAGFVKKRDAIKRKQFGY